MFKLALIDLIKVLILEYTIAQNDPLKSVLIFLRSTLRNDPTRLNRVPEKATVPDISIPHG